MGIPIDSVIAMMLKTIASPPSKDPVPVSFNNKEVMGVIAGEGGGINQNQMIREKVVSMLNGRIDEKLRHHLENNLQSSPTLRKLAEKLQQGKVVSPHEQQQVLDLVTNFLAAK